MVLVLVRLLLAIGTMGATMCVSVALAHPVPFKGGTSLTILSQTFQTDAGIVYSFHRQAAIGVRFVNFDDQINEMRFFGSQLNYLANRWNGDGFQGNVYLSAAVGPMVYNSHEHSAILTGLDADIETRQLFMSAKAEKMWTGVGYDFWHVRSRAGVAPYAADFEQLATWLMVQFEYNPILQDWSRVTPLIRLFYRTFLFEAGVSNKGEGMINFMIHI